MQEALSQAMYGPKEKRANREVEYMDMSRMPNRRTGDTGTNKDGRRECEGEQEGLRKMQRYDQDKHYGMEMHRMRENVSCDVQRNVKKG